MLTGWDAAAYLAGMVALPASIAAVVANWQTKHPMPEDEGLALFGEPPRVEPLPPVDGVALSTDRARTRRQAELLADGWHPVAGRLLHPAAASAHDRQAPGLRCRSCRFRLTANHGTAGSYAKCYWPGEETVDRLDNLPRFSRGPATDIRAWWPACADYEAADEHATNPPYRKASR